MGESSNFGTWIFAFLIVAVIFGWGGIGGGNAAAVGYATATDVTNAINTAFANQNAQSILLSSANNNYEVARLIDNQSMAMANQNNTNLLAAINGFNQVSSNIANGFSSVNANIADLGYKMDQCCCSIKTLILENRLQDAQIALSNAQNVAVNAEQSQYLLSQLGSFVPKTAPAAYTATK